MVAIQNIKSGYSNGAGVISSFLSAWGVNVLASAKAMDMASALYKPSPEGKPRWFPQVAVETRDQFRIAMSSAAMVYGSLQALR